MIAALQWGAAAALAFYLLWVHFLAVMHLKEARDTGVLDTLSKFVKTMADLVLVVGTVINLVVRVCITWAIFLEWPIKWGEWAVSAQVKRLCALTVDPAASWWRRVLPTYRRNRAVWFRDNLLKPFDKSGGHD